MKIFNNRLIDEQRYKDELARIRLKNKSLMRKQALRKEREKYRTPIVMPSTTKLILIYLFVMLNVVLIYGLIAMWHFSDLTHLGVIITDILSQVIAFIVYAAKSTKENTIGGITYQKAMRQYNNLDTFSRNIIKTEDTVKEVPDINISGEENQDAEE